jgi:hypothetical protein
MDRRPHDCCADFHSRYYTLRCYWDPTDGISLCLAFDATDSAVRTRNGSVAVDECWDIRVGVENVPMAAS